MNPVVVRPVRDDPPEARLYYGLDVIEALKLLPDASVHTVATSPPYWGLRDYGTGDAQIGLEETPDEYVGRVVEVFRHLKRVLRSDGTVWLNLGDSYATTGPGLNNPRDERGTSPSFGKMGKAGWEARERPKTSNVSGSLKLKDLVGIPWRVAFALQDDGWYLRSDIIWAKSVCMPESVRDRPTRAHEYVFLLAHPDSGGRYFYDVDAIREPALFAHRSKDVPGTRSGQSASKVRGSRDSSGGVGYHEGGRNKRSWWNINPKPYTGAHFATWPPDLVRPMILAGTSEKGCCPTCGAQWTRVTENTPNPSMPFKDDSNRGWSGRNGGAPDPQTSRSLHRQEGGVYNNTRMLGWEPGCDCLDHEPVRSVVLDPFSGSATTGMVAIQEGRHYVGIDLNADYLELAQARVLERKPPPSSRDDDEVISLIEELFGE